MVNYYTSNVDTNVSAPMIARILSEQEKETEHLLVTNIFETFQGEMPVAKRSSCV